MKDQKKKKLFVVVDVLCVTAGKLTTCSFYLAHGQCAKVAGNIFAATSVSSHNSHFLCVFCTDNSSLGSLVVMGTQRCLFICTLNFFNQTKGFLAGC